MNYFERVEASFDELPYMRHPQATFMREFIIEHDVRDILEIGFYHGKSSAYFAAILEDLGRGHLVTIDRENALHREPDIMRVLSTLDLTHRVTPVFAERSFTWELGKMLQGKPLPQFDLCYFDGDHTWDGTGFGFVLVDRLLRPGGWIVFDDLPWTMEAAMKTRAKIPRYWRACSEDERAAAGVNMVFELLVPQLGYTDIRIANGGWWGIARKPFDRAANSSPPRETTALARILKALIRR
jgi:predicted O-methyltransferase YrrM